MGGDVSKVAPLQGNGLGQRMRKLLAEGPMNPNGHPSRRLRNAPIQGLDLLEEVPGSLAERVPGEALPPLSPENYASITEALGNLLVTSNPDIWPADGGVGPTGEGGNYAGLFIRLAWHCGGSYRASDGRGGCDGARIRFPPEFFWDDNTQLDKALALLEPIFQEYDGIASRCACSHSMVFKACQKNLIDAICPGDGVNCVCW